MNAHQSSHREREKEHACQDKEQETRYDLVSRPEKQQRK
jgi:hypothetical protein